MQNRRHDDANNHDDPTHIHADADDHPLYYEHDKHTYLLGRLGRYIDRHERGFFWSVVCAALAAFGVVIVQ